jgi:hypothetical protein
MNLERLSKTSNGERVKLELRLETVSGVGRETTNHEPAPDKFLRVSISGEVAPRGVRFGTNASSYGQVLDSLPKPSPIYNAWVNLHLNDLKAGCAHQDSTSELGDTCLKGYGYGTKWLVKLPPVLKIVELLRMFDAPQDTTIVSRDGCAVAVFPSQWDAVAYLHTVQGQSIDHATKYEGWAMYNAYEQDFKVSALA